MAKLSEYTFPAPPVCTVYWDERAWYRYARSHGFIARRGPAPSVELYDGRFAPFSGQFDMCGEPLYDTDRAFRPALRR